MICKNCGHDNDNDDLFCRNCGKILEKNSRPKINLSKNSVTKSETTETVFADTPSEESRPKINLSKNSVTKSETTETAFAGTPTEENIPETNTSQNGILKPVTQDTAADNTVADNTVVADSILTGNIISEENIFCKRCGHKLDKADRFCDRCGKSVAEEPAQPEYTRPVMPYEIPSQPVRNKKKTAVVAVASLIGLFVICFVAYFVYEEVRIEKGTDEILSMTENSSYDESSEQESAITTIQTTGQSEKITTTAATVETTASKSSDKTYDVTFELDELLDEAGLQLGGHVGVAVLSNFTCNNGKATAEVTAVETESFVYDNLVRIKITGAEAGKIVIGGTITTYGIDTVDGKTVSYPDNSGVFLIERTVGDNSSDKTTTTKKVPSISGSITKQSSTFGDGYDIYINVSGDYDYYSYKYYEANMPDDELILIDSGDESSPSFRVSGFSAGISYVYADITPYSNDGTAGKTITVRLDIDTGSKQTVNNKATISSCNKSGQINCHGGTVAGFTTSYVAEGGAVGKIRSSLGDKWHVTAYNTCTSMGVTWYELYDSDDGDYYGWVDSGYIDFY